jgi:hypothetical protein
MPGDKEVHRDAEESVRHAQWVREHAQMDESGFPEYPDEVARRGSSRGALPNGNPWHPIDAGEKPGRPEWDADTDPAPWRDGESDWPNGPEPAPAEPAAVDGARASPHETQNAVAAPVLGEPTHQPAIVIASTEGDERIGHDIGDLLAASKTLDGKHVVVEVVDGEVYLLGTVPDQSIKSQVEQLASSVRGVAHIHNELDLKQ